MADVAASDEWLTGRRWHIDTSAEPDAAGFPIIRPDPATGLEPLSPTHLVLHAVAGEEGPVWAFVYEHWKQAVQSYAAARSGWTPIKERTLADGLYTAARPSAVLDDWLARMERRFPDWAASTGGEWDYSPDSITRLVTMVLRAAPTGEALRDPANTDFVDGASYYLGEVLRRGCRITLGLHRFQGRGRPGYRQLQSTAERR